MARISIDPITRIEGHLRIDVEVDGGAVQKAWASCTMWRGIETILLGRDPREGWVFAQRFCGVCTTVHAIASVRAVEDALQLEIPANAQYIRNLILIAHALHDHIVHFYQLSALDWVDITTIPKADPARAASIADSVGTWEGNSHRKLEDVQNKVKGLIGSGQLGIFSHGYWGHPAMRLSPEVNLILFAHYLQALEFQRKALQVVGILGGKTPHIQNLAVGGVMNAINLNSLATMNMDRLGMLQSLLQEVIPFVQAGLFRRCMPASRLLPRVVPLWTRRGELSCRPGPSGGRKGHAIRSSRWRYHERESRVPCGRFKIGVTKPSARRLPRMSRTRGTWEKARSPPGKARPTPTTPTSGRTGSTRG